MMVHGHGMYSIRTAWTDMDRIVSDARGDDFDGADRLGGVGKSHIYSTHPNCVYRRTPEQSYILFL